MPNHGNWRSNNMVHPSNALLAKAPPFRNEANVSSVSRTTKPIGSDSTHAFHSVMTTSVSCSRDAPLVECTRKYLNYQDTKFFIPNTQLQHAQIAIDSRLMMSRTCRARDARQSIIAVPNVARLTGRPTRTRVPLLRVATAA